MTVASFRRLHSSLFATCRVDMWLVIGTTAIAPHRLEKQLRQHRSRSPRPGVGRARAGRLALHDVRLRRGRLEA